MKINDFYKIVKQAAFEAAGYTFPPRSMDGVLAKLGIGAAFGRNVQEFFNRPFVQAALPQILALGIIDAEIENVNIDPLLSGIDALIEQDEKVDVGNFTIDAKEFKLLRAKIQGVSNEQTGISGAAQPVG